MDKKTTSFLALIRSLSASLFFVGFSSVALAEVGVIETEEGVVTADAVAKDDTYSFQAFGGEEGYRWFLSDKTFGTLSDFYTGEECEDSGVGILCTDVDRIRFTSAEKEGTVILTLTDIVENTHDTIISILPPALKDILIFDQEGEEITGALFAHQDERLTFTAEKILENNEREFGVEGTLSWEFQFEGEDWTDSSDKGTVAGGVLHPQATGTYRVRSKMSQEIAAPGTDALTQKEETIFSDAVTVEVSDPASFIDSIRTAGNAGFAKGTTDILYTRIRNFGTIANIGDIELNIFRGKYENEEEIPEGVQYFDIHLVADEILAENASDKTVLLEIPFEIPLLADITEGWHTLRLIVNNANGQEEGVSEALLPIYIGVPEKGDVTLDGDIDLRDAVQTLRFARETEVPTTLQIAAAGNTPEKGIVYADFLSLFQSYLSSFLK